jgi:hypothetical protein
VTVGFALAQEQHICLLILNGVLATRKQKAGDMDVDTDGILLNHSNPQQMSLTVSWTLIYHIAEIKLWVGVFL